MRAPRLPAAPCSGKVFCHERHADRTLLAGPIVAINIGLDQFARSLEEQKAKVVQVDWVPPAGGDKDMLEILDSLL